VTGIDVRALLAGGEDDGNRELTTWAIGVQLAGCHTLTVVEMLENRYTTDTHGYTGGTVRISGGRHGAQFFRLSAADLRYRLIAEVTWRQVAALVTPELVGADLIGEMREALAERRRRTRVPDPRRPRDWYLTAEAVAERDAWADIERRCYRLGEEAWLRCRPAEVHEPADLLELLATMEMAA
jgi:hypothetical protein